MLKKVGVIGSGFSGLAAAACLAKAGFEVTVLEKNNELGGRARKFETQGFTFDMGPSWYWMPEVFEQFFNLFDKKSSDFYELVRLDPSYEVLFGKDDKVALPADFESLKNVFESIETGSSVKLEEFLADAEYKYKVGMSEFVWKPGHSIMEFADIRVVMSLFRLQMLSSISSQIDRLFKSEKIRNILKFPVLFLGATPENTPALYSLMNYADLKLGTWYPLGGMFKVIDAFVEISENQGVKFIRNAEVKSISVKDNLAHIVNTENNSYTFDYVVASADYHHVEQKLLPEAYRNYSESYWQKRTMAPSSLLFYLGLDIKLENVKHHNLFFDRDFAQHAHEIYTEPSWPSEPLFYMCVPSVTDASLAPEGNENVFILMPLAPGIEDNDILREQYFDIICKRLEDVTGINIKPNIIYKKSYCVNDFVSDYNAFRGNAYGLANTLKQTAFLKPKLRNKFLSNLYYTGQLTSPGPGVPPSIISGQVVASEIIKTNK
ncbi:MAG: phytoene desaturase [Saprospiraceae bacterium]|nr:phytoene desaturase [Saprospiraceae bacterium]MBP6567023.1 phytoene desaturase [Saprospiraceae bacterium]